MSRPIAFAVPAFLLLSLSACSGGSDDGATAQTAERMAPRFEVDPLWPKPLPNGWVIGSAIGVSVDSRDHVWIIHRAASLNDQTEASAGINTPDGTCCSAAPPVLEFDPAGNLVGYWGGPGDGYEWPESNHGITVDHMDNVWIGGNGTTDAHLLKFTRDGRFLMQLGSQGGPEEVVVPDPLRIADHADHQLAGIGQDVERHRHVARIHRDRDDLLDLCAAE